jgi:hypothetical protein
LHYRIARVVRIQVGLAATGKGSAAEHWQASGTRQVTDLPHARKLRADARRARNLGRKITTYVDGPSWNEHHENRNSISPNELRKSRIPARPCMRKKMRTSKPGRTDRPVFVTRNFNVHTDLVPIHRARPGNVGA